MKTKPKVGDVMIYIDGDIKTNITVSGVDQLYFWSGPLKFSALSGGRYGNFNNDSCRPRAYQDEQDIIDVKRKDEILKKLHIFFKHYSNSECLPIKTLEKIIKLVKVDEND